VNGTERQITDPHEGLIRRAYRSGRSKHIITDQLTGIRRAPAAAFEPRQKDEALSVNLESSLREAGLPLTWGLDPAKQYATRITVGDCSANALEVFHKPVNGNPHANPPVPENPHHGLIRGLVEMRVSDRDTYERTLTALAKASSIVSETD
jgi:hypothetical protein